MRSDSIGRKRKHRFITRRLTGLPCRTYLTSTLLDWNPQIRILLTLLAWWKICFLKLLTCAKRNFPFDGHFLTTVLLNVSITWWKCKKGSSKEKKHTWACARYRWKSIWTFVFRGIIRQGWQFTLLHPRPIPAPIADSVFFIEKPKNKLQKKYLKIGYGV